MSEDISFISYIINKYKDKIMNQINDFIHRRLVISIGDAIIKLSYRENYKIILESKYFYTDDLINQFESFRLAYFIKVSLNNKDKIPYGYNFSLGFKWIELFIMKY